MVRTAFDLNFPDEVRAHDKYLIQLQEEGFDDIITRFS